MKTHELWMSEAFKEAEKAYNKKEVPLGAVVVFEKRIIGRGHNQVETLKDPTAHAEIIANLLLQQNICLQKFCSAAPCMLHLNPVPCARAQ